ncbi:hypothetical protein [Pararhizobium sp. A13]|uniref:hypothetical protein n=1 Tax=Pararhizobium sp. A13 TaxID=3133975 RepID=UPI00324F4ABB
MAAGSSATDSDDDADSESFAVRMLLSLARVPFAILRGTILAIVYSVWYLAFYVLCMFRPFTGLMVLAAIVTVPMTIMVFAHRDAARGMPFWAFGLLAIALVAFALGYALFVDRITPPGAEDPFDRYRKRR